MSTGRVIKILKIFGGQYKRPVGRSGMVLLDDSGLSMLDLYKQISSIISIIRLYELLEVIILVLLTSLLSLLGLVTISSTCPSSKVSVLRNQVVLRPALHRFALRLAQFAQIAVSKSLMKFRRLVARIRLITHERILQTRFGRLLVRLASLLGSSATRGAFVKLFWHDNKAIHPLEEKQFQKELQIMPSFDWPSISPEQEWFPITEAPICVLRSFFASNDFPYKGENGAIVFSQWTIPVFCTATLNFGPISVDLFTGEIRTVLPMACSWHGSL
jgi:hypothetical protein